jgi:hypothetical protein
MNSNEYFENNKKAGSFFSIYSGSKMFFPFLFCVVLKNCNALISFCICGYQSWFLILSMFPEVKII